MGEHWNVQYTKGQSEPHGNQGDHAAGYDDVDQEIPAPVECGQQGDDQGDQGWGGCQRQTALYS